MNGASAAGRICLFSSCLPGWSARRVADLAVALGFATVEWGVGQGQAIERADAGSKLRKLCDGAGLRTVGVSIQEAEVDLGVPGRVSEYVQLAVELGAPFVRVFAPPYRGGDLAEEQRHARGGVDAIVELAAAAGIATLVETAPGTLAPSADLAAELVEHHAPAQAGVLYDPGNTVIEGYLEPRLALARLGAQVRHVHVKNIGWASREGRWQWRYASLVRGQIDWPEMMAALGAAAYDGGFSIDHLPGAATRRLLAAETDTLRRLLAGGAGQAVGETYSNPRGAATSPTNA